MKIENAFLPILIFIMISASLFAVDIKMVGIYISPPLPCTGVGDYHSITVRGVVRSAGAPSNNVFITFGAGENEIYSQTIPHLDADVDVNVDCYFSDWKPGVTNYTFWYKLDPDQVSEDSNRNNNTATKTLDVSSCPPMKPNLFPEIKFEKEVFHKDNDITIKYSSLNWNYATSVPSEMQLLINNQVVQTCQVPALKEHERKDCLFSWKVVCDATIKVTADSSKTNDETDEYDNSRTKKAKCKRLDLQRDQVSPTGPNK